MSPERSVTDVPGHHNTVCRSDVCKMFARLGPKRSCAHRRWTNPQVGDVGAGWRGGYCTGFETGALAGRSAEIQNAKPQVKPSGGGRESNPPSGVSRFTGFEDRGAHQAL